jgi:hemoglobin
MPDPNETLYQRLGEAGIARLVDRLYEWMAILPEAQDVMRMHPADMDEVRARLRAFLAAWFGGPDRYTAAYGEPRMRMRHMPFAIGRSERDAWLACLYKALDDTVAAPDLRAELHDAFTRMADHMRNRVERPEDAARMQCHCTHHPQELHP